MKNENEEKNHSTVVIETIAANFTKGNQKAVALQIGVAQSTLASWKERNNADIMAIAAAFPEVSAEWLLRAKGPMLLSDKDFSRNYTINGGSGNTQVAEGCTMAADPLGTAAYFAGSDEIIKNALDRLIGQLDSTTVQIKEKDAQLREKDSQISSLLDIIKSQNNR